MRIFLKNQSGASIIEFALIAPVFFLLILGIIEFGMIGFSQVAIESAVAATAREASLGKSVGGDRALYVREHVRKKLSGLINVDKLVISAHPVVSGGGAEPDICLTSPPSVGGPCPTGTPYEEVNGIPGYQDSIPAVSLGSAGDVVEVRIYYPWKVQLPVLNRFFGPNGVYMMRTSTIIKNEPF